MLELGGVDPIMGRKEGKLEEERQRPIPDTRVTLLRYSGALVMMVMMMIVMMMMMMTMMMIVMMRTHIHLLIIMIIIMMMTIIKIMIMIGIMMMMTVPYNEIKSTLS